MLWVHLQTYKITIHKTLIPKTTIRRTQKELLRAGIKLATRCTAAACSAPTPTVQSIIDCNFHYLLLDFHNKLKIIRNISLSTCARALQINLGR